MAPACCALNLAVWLKSIKSSAGEKPDLTCRHLHKAAGYLIQFVQRLPRLLLESLEVGLCFRPVGAQCGDFGAQGLDL